MLAKSPCVIFLWSSILPFFLFTCSYSSLFNFYKNDHPSLLEWFCYWLSYFIWFNRSNIPWVKDHSTMHPQNTIYYILMLNKYLLHWSIFTAQICPLNSGPVYTRIFSSGQLLSLVWLFVTPWTAACQASLSFTISWSLLKLMFTESVMPSNHLILYCPLLLLPSIFPSIKVFSNELDLHIK